MEDERGREIAGPPEARPLTCGELRGHWIVEGLELVRCVHRSRLRLSSHDHERPTLLLVLDGVGRETVGRQTFELAPGYALFRPARTEHAKEVGAEAFHSIIVGLPQHLGCVPREIAVASSSGFLRDARTISHELAARLPGWQAIVASTILGVLGRLWRSSEVQDRCAWLDRAAELAAVGASLSAIAQEVERSPSLVARAFRRRFGVSIGTFFRRERLRQAERDLRSGKPICEVALECGFFDQSHFTRAFRSEFGVTPARYRREAASGR